MSVKAIPAGYHTLTPYLIVNDAAKALAFYEQALGAKELFRLPGSDGRIGHAEMLFGDSHLMLADESVEMGYRSPSHYGGVSLSLMQYVDDVDAVVAKAVALGAKITRPVADQFYGDRNGTIEDPFGHQWTIATHIEDVSPEDLDKRLQAMAANQGSAD